MNIIGSLIMLALKNPAFIAALIPVLREALPIFKQLREQHVPQDQAAQKAIAVAAPYITTPPELHGLTPTESRMSDVF